MRRILNLSAGWILMLYVVGSWAQPNTSIKLSTGFFYADGQSNDLNVPDSTLKSVPLSIQFKHNRFGMRLSSSWLEVNSGGVVDAGQGDTTVAISYDLTENPWWTLTVKEKFATGDSGKGLSTGYNDTKIQVDYFQAVGRERSVFATLGYTFKGGQSDVSTYQDAAYASVGMGVVLSQGWNGGVSFDYYQATSRTLDDTLGGSVFIGHKLSQHFGVNVFAAYDSAQTTSLGLGLSYKLQ